MSEFLKTRLLTHPSRRTMMKGLAGMGLLASMRTASAQDSLLVGDQKGGTHALLSAATSGHIDNAMIKWSLFAGAPMLIQALAANAVDAGAIGDAPLAFAQDGTSTIRAIAGIQSDGTTTAIITRHDSPIHTVGDLKGRSIATLRAQTGHYLTLAALRAAGMHDDDVRFVFLPPVSARAALQTGAVDAWATWGPYVSTAVITDGAREIVNGGQLMSGLSYIVATVDALHAKKDALATYIRQLKAAHQWGRAHLDEYATAWAADVGFPLAVARHVVPTMLGNVVTLDPHVIQKQQDVCDFMYDTRMLSHRLDARAIMDTGFIL